MRELKKYRRGTNDDMIYLATPYSKGTKATMLKRFKHVTAASSLLIDVYGIVPFSPITQSHEQNKVRDLENTWAFWEWVDMVFIKKSDELWVIIQDGWQDSVGVSAEILAASKLAIPIKYLIFDEKQDKIFDCTVDILKKAKANIKKREKALH